MNDFFTFDDIKSTDKNIILEKYSPIFLSNTRKNFIYIPGRNGSVQSKSDSREDVTIVCEVAVLGPDIMENILQANTWLSKRGKLSFWDMTNKYYEGELVDEIPMTKFRRWNKFTLNFRCNPIKYGETKTKSITEDNIINSGTYKTTGAIVIEITEAIDHIEATLVDTGEYVRVDHDFIVGDTVTIDLENEMVYKNGFSIMQDCHLESDFFDIPVGEFLITVNTGDSTLEFTERWL